MLFKLKGMQELIKALEAKGTATDKISEAAVMAGAEVIRSAIARRAPRDPQTKEHMADNIVISEFNPKTKSVDIGAEQRFYYARFVEFGTSKMKKSHAFAFPAFEESKAEALETMANIIRKEIER